MQRLTEQQRRRRQAAGRDPGRARLLHATTRSSSAWRPCTACPTPSSSRGSPTRRSSTCLPREYIEKNLVLPLFKIRDTLTVAVTEPSNLFLIDELRALTSLDVQIVATSAKDIRRMITTLPDSKMFVIDDIIEDNAQADVTLIEEAIDDIGDVAEIAGQSPVIRLVNYIIYNAVKEGASDIHIEPAERCMRVRYRIDGRLYKVAGSAAAPARRRHQPHQDHGLARHQRAPPAAGRPRARAARRPQDRPPRQHLSRPAAARRR